MIQKKPREQWGQDVRLLSTQAGKSLAELTVVLAIAGIIATMAVPS
jgi:prepilin-type N-terminal cleavage/methylation domain-containing protein